MAKITNEQGGTQSFVAADFDCIPPEVLKLLAECLGRGARVYGRENWKKLPASDSLSHAMNHINEWRRGDRSEPHLVNAMARLTFALWQAVDSGEQHHTYLHPDDQFPEEPSLEDSFDQATTKLPPHTKEGPTYTWETLCEEGRITVYSPGKPPKVCRGVLNTENGRFREVDEKTGNFTGKEYLYDGNGNKVYIWDTPDNQSILEAFEERLDKVEKRYASLDSSCCSLIEHGQGKIKTLQGKYEALIQTLELQNARLKTLEESNLRLSQVINIQRHHSVRIGNIDARYNELLERTTKLERDHKELDKVCAEDHSRIEKLEDFTSKQNAVLHDIKIQLNNIEQHRRQVGNECADTYLLCKDNQERVVTLKLEVEQLIKLRDRIENIETRLLSPQERKVSPKPEELIEQMKSMRAEDFAKLMELVGDQLIL